MPSYSYPALLVQQTPDAKPMLLFAAPAAEIDKWAGVPQKKKFGEEEQDETIGFQREENQKRIESLKQFFGDDHNVIQNPLLCATRVLDEEVIRFVPSQTGAGGQASGTLEIDIPNYSELSFQDLLMSVREYLEHRVPELKEKTPSEELIIRLKELARDAGHLSFSEEESAEEENVSEGESSENGKASEDLTAVLFEESHIYDFWDEIAARHEVSKMIQEPILDPVFLGFSREALASYVLPAILVDGQHRLRGAMSAARARLSSDPLKAEIEKRIIAGEKPQEIDDELLVRESRVLPVSLLLSGDPEEQVFQFVVVNQKATPIGRALLGTIVSTTLSKGEMDKVAVRLKSAGIELEESQAITYLARHPDSPFRDLIQRGLAGNGKDLLEWGVFAQLIAIFRDLKGGRLYGEKNDYADVWRKHHLEDSGIVSSYNEAGCENKFAYWSKIDGPWRDVFVKFWTKIRDRFANNEDEESTAYWGKPRQSNLFNKPSLTILAADFFQFLRETRTPLQSPEQIDTLVDEWLEGVKNSYFDRNWELSGVKKDSTGIRNQWAYLWREYRKSPELLPQTRLYRQSKGD